MKILAGSSIPDFATSLAQSLPAPLMDVEISQFPNGEKRVWIKDTVKGENVILVQSFTAPTDIHIMEFLLLVDALERLGARHINAVIPWLGYSLQDKVFRAGEPIAAKVVADLVSNAYIKRAFLMDLHNSSTPGFFSIPVQHLTAQELFIKYAQETFDLSTCVVASPDFGGLKRARVFAEKLGLPLVNIDKHRDHQTGAVTAMGVHGDVRSKTVLVVDDVINTGSTVVSAAATLREHGATQVHFLSTHGPLVEKAFELIATSAADSVVITNSLPQTTVNSKVKIIDAAPLFAAEIATWQKSA